MSRQSQSLFFLLYHTVLPIAGLWSLSVSNRDTAICIFLWITCSFMLIVCFVLFFVVCFSSTLSPRHDRSARSGNNLMRLAIILQLAIMAYHVQIVAHELHVISRLHSRRVRKSFCRPILRLRHLSFIVHSRPKLVHVYSLLCHDITGYEYGNLVLGECGTSNKSHENRVQGAHRECNTTGRLGTF